MTWKGHRPDDRFPTARFAVFTARPLRPRFYPFHVIIRVKGLGLLASCREMIGEGLAHDGRDDAFRATV